MTETIDPIVLAYSDEELLKYAESDPAAAQELARRSVRFSGSYLHRIAELEEEIRDLEEKCEEAADEAANADHYSLRMDEAGAILRQALKAGDSLSREELEERIRMALEELE